MLGVRALHPNVEAQLRKSLIDAQTNALIDAEIEAWWRDLVAAGEAEREGAEREGVDCLEDGDATEDDADLQDDLLLCKGSSVGPSPLRAAVASNRQ